MNREEFIAEAKASDLCPDDFEKVYEEFSRYQRKAMDTLKEFHRVCEKNSVEYQLAYGSLLGAIRDCGQIPWDYDIDVFVPYEQKQKLIDALKNDLDEKFYFYCPEMDSQCRHVIMRLAPKGCRSEALHVDVFYLTGAPENVSEREYHKRLIKKMSDIRFYKLVNVAEEGKGHPKLMLQMILGKIRNLFQSVEGAYKQYDALCSRYSVWSSTYCVSADSFADWYDFPAKYIYETQLISTECGQFRISVHYEELLSIMYGDYRKIPPLKNRLNELFHHYERLTRFHAEK